MRMETMDNDGAGNEGMMAAMTGQDGMRHRDRLAGDPTHAVVVGLGRSGLSCARFLTGLGLDVDVYDSNERPVLAGELARLAPAARLHAGSLRIDQWRDDSLLVVSPGVPLAHPQLATLLAKGVRPVGDVELFAQCAQAPIVAITGSNGKSTVTALTGEILCRAGREVRVGGNIGVPALDLLDDGADSYVLELSSFQLETTWSLDARCATVLNLAPDHMNRYDGMDDYVAAKARIHEGSGTMVINADDPGCARLQRPGRETLWFTSGAPVSDAHYGLREHAGAVWLARGESLLMNAAGILMPGAHNRMNVLAAWALANCMGADDEAVRAAVTGFRGLPHRMEWLGRHGGIDWINDSKGTNVGATVAAIEGLDGPLVLIAGGQGKGADFTPLADAIADKVKGVVLIGEDAEVIGRALAGRTRIMQADDMQDAVHRAAGLAGRNGTVLLSPACASFDMYSGFEARGDDFRQCVEGLD